METELSEAVLKLCFFLFIDKKYIIFELKQKYIIKQYDEK